jgi:hypothetical protein
MANKPIDWKPVYLEALRNVPVIKHACEAAGIDRTTAWRTREADEAFAKAEQEAMEEGIDRAEQEAFRRAVVGFEEPVIDKGRLAYRYERFVDEEGGEHYRILLDQHGQPVPLTTRKHSDALLSLFLKGRRKKVYADRTELTGAEGGPVQAVDETAKAARVAQLMALAQQRKAEADEFGDLA